MSNLAKAHCENGHSWDAWGIWEVRNEIAHYAPITVFEPENLRTVLCPTCDGIAIQFTHPERLA